jgi:hypothetical protein
MKNGVSFEIASVFTEPRLRGSGYASQLLEAVAARMAENPRAQALTLYSDVDSSVYTRSGFNALPSFDWVFAARRAKVPEVSRCDGEAYVAQMLAQHPARGRFALHADAAQVDWHRARERIYAQLLDLPTVAHGVLRCAEGHALLAGDVKNARLVILRLCAERVSTAEQLLRAAADEAHRAALPEVVMWAAPYGGDEIEAEAAQAIGAIQTARSGSVPMLRALPGSPRIVARSWTEIPRLSWV